MITKIRSLKKVSSCGPQRNFEYDFQIIWPVYQNEFDLPALVEEPMVIDCAFELTIKSTFAMLKNRLSRSTVLLKAVKLTNCVNFLDTLNTSKVNQTHAEREYELRKSFRNGSKIRK